MKKKRLDEIIAEDCQLLLEDDDELASYERIWPKNMKKMVERNPEEEELLQTRIVSPKDVLKDWSRWKEAIDLEVNALLKEKMAFEEVDEEEEKKLEKEARERGRKVQYIPSSLVFARKPGPHGGKRKARWVVSGNFEERQGSENNFSSGADAAAFRVMVWMMAKKQWKAAVLDIKTAFLNADLVLTADEDTIIVLQPQILKEKRYFDRRVSFKPVKAVCGFRRSPKLWGGHRNQEMLNFVMKVKIDGRDGILWLKQMQSEENMWKVIRSESEDERCEDDELVGLVMTYVDDVTVAGSEVVVETVIRKFQSTWASSDPQSVNRESVRFLGMDLKRIEGPENRDEWTITQESYTRDLLERYPDLPPRRIPISRDQSLMSEDASPPLAGEVKEAQRNSSLVGDED